eukprot:6210128-Pleurochrysis_carterae.AAC.1
MRIGGREKWAEERDRQIGAEGSRRNPPKKSDMEEKKGDGEQWAGVERCLCREMQLQNGGAGRPLQRRRVTRCGRHVASPCSGDVAFKTGFLSGRLGVRA